MKRSHRFNALAALASFLLVGTACSTSQERPEQALASAETGIEFAAESGASQHAAVALERARDHLQQARSAADAGNYEDALAAAEKAEADAELAAAQTSRQKAEATLEEIRESIDVLRREIARSQAAG